MADMLEQAPCIYGLKKQVKYFSVCSYLKSRCLVAGFNSDRSRFFAGSLGLKQENEVFFSNI